MQSQLQGYVFFLIEISGSLTQCGTNFGDVFDLFYIKIYGKQSLCDMNYAVMVSFSFYQKYPAV